MRPHHHSRFQSMHYNIYPMYHLIYATHDVGKSAIHLCHWVDSFLLLNWMSPHYLLWVFHDDDDSDDDNGPRY